MSKMVQLHEEGWRSLLKGVQTLGKAVRATFGPKGRNVVIRKEGGLPLSTKDGVTVAQEIVLQDKFENMGAQLVKDASSKTADRAGDGTTTAIILAEAIYTEGVRAVIAGANPVDVKKGIDKAVSEMCTALEELATSISKPIEIEQIAAVAAGNDREVGALIAQALEKVGKDGIVSFAEAHSMETTIDILEGLQFDKGYLSPYFITHPEKMTAEMESPSIFITDKKLSTVQEIVLLLEKIMEKGPTPLLIIADDIEGDALATLVVNKIKGGIPICAVKAPAFGDFRKAFLQDMALVTGATVLTEDTGLSLKNFDLTMLGCARRVQVGKETTIITEGCGNRKELQKRIEELRAEIAHASSSSDIDRLKERLAKLAGGVALIRVGAPTGAEMKEKKARMDDALHAARAAACEGIVPGGGVALLRAVKALDNLQVSGDEQVGVESVRKAAFAPTTVMASNCGKAGNLIAEKVFERQGAWGYNGLTDEFADLMKEGVIDPVLVTKSALVHAGSVAGVLLTVAALVAEKPQPPST